jgi:hypothetical protein
MQIETPSYKISSISGLYNLKSGLGISLNPSLEEGISGDKISMLKAKQCRNSWLERKDINFRFSFWELNSIE